MLCALTVGLLAAELALGTWSARLDSPLGPLPFEFAIADRDGHLVATIVNGAERIDAPLTATDTRIEIAFPHYAAAIVAVRSPDGRALEGEWTKRAGPEKVQRLPFHARLGARPPANDEATALERVARFVGRWRVRFERDSEPAVAVFEAGRGSADALMGTFLTATGDYRYLAGHCEEQLVLTTFDGAHAFRFAAELQPDGSLAGTFCSGETWKDSWTAVRDEAAKLEREFERTRWDDSFAWNELVYPNLAGERVSLGDPRYDGRVRLLQVTGSWCPNCHDETALLAELDREFRSQGLSITALCFELTGEREKDTEAARSLLERHGAAYEALLVGRSDKNLARDALPALDRVFAFPTTIFVGRDGKVRAVHAGFLGPATGQAGVDLRTEFRRRITELIAEPTVTDEALREAVTHELWRDELENSFTSLERDPAGAWRFTTREIMRFGAPMRPEPLASGDVGFFGTTVVLGPKTWSYDRSAHVLLDPDDCGRRLTPAARSPFPVVDGVGHHEFAEILAGLSSGKPIRRRESAYYLALQITTDRLTPPEYGGGVLPSGVESNLLPLLDDADARVRATACWGAGFTGLAVAVSALEKNLEHGFAPVRREAARALAAIDVKAARERLARMARHDVDPLVRAASVR